MICFIMTVVFLLMLVTLAYQRASLSVWTLSWLTYLIITPRITHMTFWHWVVVWLVFFIIFVPLYSAEWRRRVITQRLLDFYKKNMPKMSRTEREALEAGTVGWEGDLFRGNPNWDTLLKCQKATLSDEEIDFINGPLEKLCGMINDWDITHHRADLPPDIWDFLKTNGFFGLIIPKEFGGKAFSAYAQSQILVKLYSCSSSVATTVAVPNSLGPAELLLHYGTSEQKNYYLPRLATGKDIPCFALTGPDAGSDAGAMPDTGVVCYGEYEGSTVLGIRLNWNKRYITLAPVATVIGLAFKLYDPDHLIGDRTDLGITCALISRETTGVHIGRRHFPLNIVFQNGPTQGKEVFIPLEWIIGGKDMAGQGWRMLMECLAAGRAISLPSSSTGGSKALTYASGAYGRVRRQFNTAIGRMEGVEEALARIAGNMYLIDALRTFTAAAIDSGQKPAVASAITKYHTTELGRILTNDAMDVHGGKGICLGPRNYLGRIYQAIPIAITVEGANILTRNLIIFGQGAMRCHPFLLAELNAAKLKDPMMQLVEFDRALLGHVSFAISNVVRSFILAITGARIVKAPGVTTKRYFQYATRFSAAFALLADVSMLIFGGALKRKESVSARLGDIVSYLYMVSAVLKQYYDQGKPVEDLPLIRWACQTCFYQIQQRIIGLLNNFPNKLMAFLVRCIIFPLGASFRPPSDKLCHQVARLILSDNTTRDRLTQGAYLTADDGNALASLQDALLKTMVAEPIEKIIKTAQLAGQLEKGGWLDMASMAMQQNIISKGDFELLVQAEEARQKVIAVDDFDPEDLTH